jgi:hypothetical protein
MLYESVLSLPQKLSDVSLRAVVGRPRPPSVPSEPARDTVCDLQLNAPPTTPSVAMQAKPDGLLTVLCDTVAELRKQQQQRLREMQTVAVELAMAIASHLVHERIKVSDFAIEALVHKVVHRLEPKHTVIVHLHPDDLELLQRRMSERDGAGLSKQELRFVPDAALQRGDCRAETGDVSVVYQLEDQLAEIRQHLIRSLSDAEVERRRVVFGEKGLRRFPERRATA